MARSLDDEIDRLYQLPPDAFTDARNRLAARIQARGDVEQAGRVRALVKPSLSAWVVNRLYRKSSRAFQRLIASGAELRSIQQGGTAEPAELRAAMQRRKQALGRLTGAAETLLGEAGRPARAMLRRVEATLDAIATLGGSGPDQALGRLSRDLEPPGFDALLALQAPATPAAVRRKATARASPAGRRADDSRERARATLRQAEQAERERAAETQRADAARVRAEARVRKSKVELEAARRRMQEVKDEHDEALAELRRARAAASRAAGAAKRAATAAAGARTKLQRIEGGGK